MHTGGFHVVYGASFVLIGVAVEGFYVTTDRRSPDIMFPLAHYAAVRKQSGELTQADIVCQILGRLRPGVTDRTPRLRTD